LVTLCLATSSNPKTLFSPAMADSYAPETKFPSERVSPSQRKFRNRTESSHGALKRKQLDC
jgi:hypothetical protein